MDDGWQQCNCSTHQDVDPALAACPSGAAMSFHDPQSGAPLVNKHRFPDMKAMVDFGHSLGLKVGTYLNNCICMENRLQPHYEQDAKWLVDMGFDGVKIDGESSSRTFICFTLARCACARTRACN